MRGSIRGIQRAQKANLKHIASLQPSGSMGMAVKAGTIMAHKSAVRKTHVKTGALRASHRIQLSGLRGLIYIDPDSVNPKGGKPSEYGLIEHARGGSHAFYRRVYDEDGKKITKAVASEFLRGFRQ